MTARDNVRPVTALLAFLVLLPPAEAQAQTRTFTRADTLRGSITPERAWWDVTFYDLHVRLDPSDSTVRGRNAITYRVTGKPREMQIDLQEPLRVDSVMQAGHRLHVPARGERLRAPDRPAARRRDEPPSPCTTAGGRRSRRTRLGRRTDLGTGAGRRALDQRGLPGARRQRVVADQGHQADEPDSQRVALTVPDPAPGPCQRAAARRREGPGAHTYEWFVSDPINNYAVAVAAAGTRR